MPWPHSPHLPFRWDWMCSHSPGLTGLPFAFVAVEMDEALSAACSACLPHSLHFPDVRAFSASSLSRDLLDAQFWMVLIVGGSGGQGNSVLHRTRQGMKDPRTRLFMHIRRVFDESRVHWPSALSLAILENVQNAPACFQEAAARSFAHWPSLDLCQGLWTCLTPACMVGRMFCAHCCARQISSGVP